MMILPSLRLLPPRNYKGHHLQNILLPCLLSLTDYYVGECFDTILVFIVKIENLEVLLLGLNMRQILMILIALKIRGSLSRGPKQLNQKNVYFLDSNTIQSNYQTGQC